MNALKHGISSKVELARNIRKNWDELERWQKKQAQAAPPPFYGSVDLRDAGFKVAPVDHNVFPAGFNNICPEDQRTAPDLIRETLAQRGVAGKRVLLIPESHTLNTFYAENLVSLIDLLTRAGLDVLLGWLPSLENPEAPLPTLKSASGAQLHPGQIRLENGVISWTPRPDSPDKRHASSVSADWILLNNDFSGGYPPALNQLPQMSVLPSHLMGWHHRKKSDHFKHYNDLALEFASICRVDPWLIQVHSQKVEPIDFQSESGFSDLKTTAKEMLALLQTEYAQRSIQRKPYVYIKNNAGTYGIGIMHIHSDEELDQLNRRTRNKMSVGKNRSTISSVIVQEGVPTATLVDRLPAEPVIYLSGSSLLGGFLRTNSERDEEGNLNSQGMVFRKLCMSDLRAAIEEESDVLSSDQTGETTAQLHLELVYGSIAQLCALAAGREMAALSLKRS